MRPLVHDLPSAPRGSTIAWLGVASHPHVSCRWVQPQRHVVPLQALRTPSSGGRMGLRPWCGPPWAWHHERHRRARRGLSAPAGPYTGGPADAGRP